MITFPSAGELIAPGKEEMMICIPAKRETGERPVRPRHCDGAEHPAIPLVRRIGKGGCLMMPEPGDLHKASVAHASGEVANTSYTTSGHVCQRFLIYAKRIKNNYAYKSKTEKI